MYRKFAAALVYGTLGCLCLSASSGESLKPTPIIDRPLIADNQQFLAIAGTTDNKGLCKDTYQNYFLVKVAAQGLEFPLTQTYSDWNDSENQTTFSNSATYRAAVSLNRGPWIQLTWGGAKSKVCPLKDVIVNDPLPIAVKPGDRLYLRTEITVPTGGKWGQGAQARQSDPDPNWTEGGTNTADDALLSDHADFRPQNGLFTHTAQGVFGQPLGKGTVRAAIILGDSISPYVLDAALSVGNDAPIANFGQAGESAARFWNAGTARQKLLHGYPTMLFEYGVNDMRSNRTFAQLQSDALNIWKAFRQSGGRHLIVFTLTPLSASTDGFKTEDGQTPSFKPEDRRQYNDWVRSLTKKQIGMDVTVIDTATLFESAANNDLWKPLPGGSPTTDDGVHPNGAGYATIKTQIGPRIQAAILEQIKP